MLNCDGHMRLEGKVGLITGASSGIGRATSILFAKEGARLVVADISNTGEEVIRTIKNNGGEATFIRADVSKALDVQKMIDGTVKQYGRLDILYNNAGITFRAPVTETDEDMWDRTMDANLKGVFLGCKYAIPVMRKQGGGVIINTASLFAIVGAPMISAYCASKGGVAAFTRAVALEVAPYKIRVNCVCPGTTVTPMMENLWAASGKPDEARESRLKAHPIGRLGKPEEIAQAVLFLASDESSFVTGSSLVVDGGATAQ